LTGTPIQNSLGDFGALLQFLGVHPFDTPSGFAKLLPTNGKDGNTTGWRKLTSLFRAVALRRTKASVLNELGLPKRTILFHTVELNERESELYQKLKQAYVLGSGADGAPMTCFQIILRLRQVCGHGPELLPREIRRWLHSDDPAGVPIPQVCELCEERMKIGNQNSARNEPVSSCLHLVCETCRAVSRSSVEPQDARFGLGCPLCLGLAISEKSTKPAPCANTQPGSYTPSSKVVALLENLNRNLREPSSLQPKRYLHIQSIITFMPLLSPRVDQSTNTLACSVSCSLAGLECLT
jgi:SWI/SNF-related matrix-associated actin-dependent regulator of chromatin subfamily A3